MGLPSHVAMCFSVRDCGGYLPSLFANIEDLRKGLPDTRVTCIFIYDNCSDNSEQLIREYARDRPDVVVETLVNLSPLRTVRIANARNRYLEILETLDGVDYHIVVDCDDVCASRWDIGVIRESLESSEGWDSLSFNRPDYYDIWALLFDGFIHHCHGFASRTCPSEPTGVVQLMQSYLQHKLAQSSEPTVAVWSAFCGFAIYKTPRFRGFRYDGQASSFQTLFTDQDRRTLEYGLICYYNMDVVCLPNGSCAEPGQVCEHLFYHVTAVRHGRKIHVSKSAVCSGGAPRVPVPHTPLSVPFRFRDGNAKVKLTREMLACGVVATQN